MSSNRDLTLGLVFGCPSTEGFQLAFTDSADSVALDTPATYRVQADQDCYIAFSVSGVTDVDSADARLLADTPEYFSIDGLSEVSAVRVTTNGTLTLTKMKGAKDHIK